MKHIFTVFGNQDGSILLDGKRIELTMDNTNNPEVRSVLDYMKKVIMKDTNLTLMLVGSTITITCDCPDLSLQVPVDIYTASGPTSLVKALDMYSLLVLGETVNPKSTVLEITDVIKTIFSLEEFLTTYIKDSHA